MEILAAGTKILAALVLVPVAMEVEPMLKVLYIGLQMAKCTIAQIVAAH